MRSYKFCPDCGHKLNDVAKKCPYCSYDFQNSTFTDSNGYVDDMQLLQEMEMQESLERLERMGMLERRKRRR